MNGKILKNLKWMESFKGHNMPVDQMRSLLKELFGNLDSIRKIQVAGTNGKGSVCQWLRLFLEENHQTCGVFTSPHMLVHFERMSINGKMISEEEWEDIFERYEPLFREKTMTMFEMDLIMAIDWFLKRKADWMIMEVGLGGTQDATSALHYNGGIITNIGMDHMAILGDTKEEIAKAKAGIIQKGELIVTAEADPACLDVIESVIKDKDATLIQADPARLEDLNLKFLPAYQKTNLSCAIALLDHLAFSIDGASIEQAANRFSWIGRFMKWPLNPHVLLDGAHNFDGIEALCQSLKNTPPEAVYFSCLADKQGIRMIERLKKLCPQITLVEFESGRKGDLKGMSEVEHLPLVSFDEMIEEIRTVQKPVLVCGSLYFIAEVLKVR